jgi:ABC-type transport system involved in multi-copper enzyme maturation permease subunit
LQTTRAWAVWFPALAAALGLLVATTAWRDDHRGSHVYALSLPIERWRFALLRFAAGAVLLAAPLLALWVGSLIAVAATPILPGLQAYPNALALRFGLAAFVAYGIFFAVSSGTSRTAAYALGAVAAVIVIDVLVRATGAELSIGREVMALLTRAPGPLAVFTGRWMLIDV